MAKQRSSDGVIFPIITPKSKKIEPELTTVIDTELTTQESISEVNIDSTHPQADIANKPITPMLDNLTDGYDKALTEEIVCKIVNEFNQNQEILNTLSIAIAEKLLKNLNSEQTFNFIKSNSSQDINLDYLQFKEMLLSYSAFLCEQTSISINQTTSFLLTQDVKELHS